MRFASLARERLIEWIARRADMAKSEDVDLFFEIFRQYFWRFRAKFSVVVILILITSSTTGFVAWFIKDIVNEIFVEQKSYLILPIFIVIIAVFVTKGLATYFQTLMSAKISNAMVADIQKRMIDHVLRQHVMFFGKHGSDDLIMRFNQGAGGFNAILTNVLINGARDGATVVALMVVMIGLDPALAAISLLVSPLVFLGVSILLRKVKEVTLQEMAGFAALNKHVRESVQGITIIKAFNLEKAASEDAHDVIAGLQDRANRIAALQSAPIPLLDTVGGIAVGLAILYAGTRFVGGEYDPGKFVSFITALLLAADPARRLSQLRVVLKTGLVMVKMVFDMLGDDMPEPSGPRTEFAIANAANGSPPPPPSIRFEDVGFAYSSESPVLGGLNLDVGSGEMVALVGPSGAGKSTVFKLLLKFYAPTSGVIRLNDVDYSEIDTHSLRNAISFVGQSNFIFSGSIRDNLTLRDSGISDERLEAACAAVGLGDYMMGLPQGYDTDVGELGSLISGGQAQRVNLVRAILKDAPVLLLDEVTSALDAENENLIKNFIKEQSRKKTILVIAHRLSTVKEADRIALMQDGRVVDVAPHEQLLKRNMDYQRMVSLQFG